MKYLLTLLICMITINTLNAQSRGEIEIGITPGIKGASIQIGYQNLNFNNTIAGWGINGTFGINYKNWEKLNYDEISESEYISHQSYFKKEGETERGPIYGGIGARIIFKSDIALEAGYIIGSFRRYENLISDMGLLYRKIDNRTEGSAYGKIIWMPEKLPISIGIGYNKFDEFGLYIGYRL